MNLAILVLAAGKGTRMESDLPKVLHQLRGQSLLAHVLTASRALNPNRLIAIVGHKSELVEAEIAPTFPEVEFVLQSETKGTGHAVMQVEAALKDFDGDIIVTCGDAPLLTTETLFDLVEKRRQNNAAASMLVGRLDVPGSYGRVVMEEGGAVKEIVEAKDADAETLALPTVNAGTYCFQSANLWAQLAQIGNNNKSGEYYLTDVVGLLTQAGQKVVGILIEEREMTGINTKAELAALESQLEQEAMLEGQSEAQPS
ncbi:MAG TPA: NTP transferase domain-containing protein [Abditibacterium sp.]|jgi:UDP-N-acetylglucosamine diphosphorylase/glucosamine-1-phosphate N-acetyltransferase